MVRYILVIACLALTACDKAAMEAHGRHLEAIRAERDREAAYRDCINGAVGMFGSASVELVKYCEAKAKDTRP